MPLLASGRNTRRAMHRRTEGKAGGSSHSQTRWCLGYSACPGAGARRYYPPAYRRHCARTRGPFWSIRPAPILLAATLGAQLVATLIAVHGLLMAPLSWGMVGLVWGYSLGMFLIQDSVKLFGYKVFSKKHSGFLMRETR